MKSLARGVVVHLVVLVGLVGLAGLAGATRVLAQDTTGTMEGAVTDKTDSAIPGARVVAKNLDTGVTKDTTAAPDGFYRLLLLPIGRYRVTVSAPQFATLVREPVEVSVSQTLRVNAQLEVRSLAETVTVAGGAPLVETASNVLGRVVTGRELVDLPLNGRNFTPLSAVYDVVSTALLPPGTGIVVAIGGSFPPDAVMLHDDGTGWQDVTAACGAGRVCGRVFSLSPFVVARRTVAADTIRPIVTPPASLRVPAAAANGVRASDSASLASWLAAGTATDADPVLTRLEPLVNGQPVTASTVFPIGSTTVTFRFRDRAGNIGSATSTLTVFVGAPSIAIRTVATGTLSGRRKYVDLDLTNVGNGHARNVYLDLVLPIPLKGFGLVKVLQPSLPKSLGSLDVGSTRRVRIELDVPSAVTLLSLTEVGHFQNVKGSLGAFVEIQKFVP